MAKNNSKTPKREAKQKRSKETIDVILTAAALVIDQFGYRAATTDRIASRAGVSVGTIYQYFNNKDEIFERFLVREEVQVVDAMKTIVSSKAPPKQLLLTFIQAGSPEYLTPKVFDELAKVPVLDETVKHLLAAAVEMSETLIQTIRPDLPSEVVQTYAMLLVTTAQGLRAASETGADEVLVATYIEMFEKFLLPDEHRHLCRDQSPIES